MTPSAPQSAANTNGLDPQLMAQIKAQMADVIEPTAIGFWPLAWGWWLLFAVVIITFIALTVFFVSRHKGNKYRRVAIAELNNHLFENYHQQCVFMMQLSKKVALLAYPTQRDAIAKATGSTWITWLNATTLQPVFTQDIANPWQAQLYQVDQGLAVNPNLSAAVKKWILNHKVTLKGQRHV